MESHGVLELDVLAPADFVLIFNKNLKFYFEGLLAHAAQTHFVSNQTFVLCGYSSFRRLHAALFYLSINHPSIYLSIHTSISLFRQQAPLHNLGRVHTVQENVKLGFGSKTAKSTRDGR